MQELLQHIDPDYYRAAQLLLVHAELARLRQGNPEPARVAAPNVTAAEVSGPHQ